MNRSYHSLLFVPAVKKMLDHIPQTKADAVIIDLEDAVLDAGKEEALHMVQDFLKSYSFATDVFVRINPKRIERETEALEKFPICGYMLPKTESGQDILALKKSAGNKKIIALIETPAGVLRAEDIAACADTDMLAFGAEDFTQITDMKNSEEYLGYIKSRLVVIAKAYKKAVFDTIQLNTTDKDAFRKSVQISKNYGFTGKLAIHPMQTEIISSVYEESNREYDLYVLREYEKSGQAILRLNDQIYEKPHIEKIKKRLQYEEIKNG